MEVLGGIDWDGERARDGGAGLREVVSVLCLTRIELCRGLGRTWRKGKICFGKCQISKRLMGGFTIDRRGSL